MSFLSFLGVGASILGNVLGHNADKSASRNAAAQAALDRQFQMDMAKNQIQWRAADAKAAGIHPLYALGPTGMSYSPPAVVGGPGGDSFRNMGQDLSRALMSGLSRREQRVEMRRLQYEAQMEEAQRAVQRERESILFDQQTRRNELQIQAMASQLANLNQPGTAPAIDSPPGSVNTLPLRRTAAGLNSEGREASAIRDYGYSINDDGGLNIVPSFDVHERIEDNFLQQWGWALRNQIVPAASGLTPPTIQEFPTFNGRALDPEHHRWEWDPFRQRFYPQEFRTGRWLR